MRFLMAFFCVLVALPVLAQSSLSESADLKLAEPFFMAPAVGVICDSFEESVGLPSALTSLHFQPESLQADRMVIDFLFTATFSKDSTTCRYTALLTRAPKNSLQKTQSAVRATTGADSCEEGRAFIDSLFENRIPFTFTKNPIRFVGLKINVAGASEVCPGSDHIRLVFEKQKVQNLLP